MTRQFLPRAFAAAALLSVASVLQAQSVAAPSGAASAPTADVAACVGKAVGSQVTFVTNRGQTLKAQCTLKEGVLSARPAGLAGPMPITNNASAPAK
jgi:hypothetical protein